MLFFLHIFIKNKLLTSCSNGKHWCCKGSNISCVCRKEKILLSDMCRISAKVHKYKWLSSHCFVFKSYQCLLKTGDLSGTFHCLLKTKTTIFGVFHMCFCYPFIKRGCTKVNPKGISASCSLYLKESQVSVQTDRKKRDSLYPVTGCNESWLAVCISKHAEVFVLHLFTHQTCCHLRYWKCQ